jgi:hypothetical protein
MENAPQHGLPDRLCPVRSGGFRVAVPALFEDELRPPQAVMGRLDDLLGLMNIAFDTGVAAVCGRKLQESESPSPARRLPIEYGY